MNLSLCRSVKATYEWVQAHTHTLFQRNILSFKGKLTSHSSLIHLRSYFFNVRKYLYLPSFMNNRLNEYRHLGLAISSHFLEILVSVLKIYLHVDVWQTNTILQSNYLPIKNKFKRFTCSLIGMLLFHSGSLCSFLFHPFIAFQSVFCVKLFIFHLCLIFGAFSGDS